MFELAIPITGDLSTLAVLDVVPTKSPGISLSLCPLAVGVIVVTDSAPSTSL